MTPTQKFALERMEQMEARPIMWAICKESFGLQLALLVDFYFMDQPPDWRPKSHEILQAIFGPGNTIPKNEMLEDEWASSAVREVRKVFAIPTT